MGLETYSRWKKGSIVVLRLAIGILFLVHGLQKLFGWFGGGGISGTEQFFAGAHLPLPLFLAYGVGILETAGGICYLIGFLTRWAALWFTILMMITTLLHIFVFKTAYASTWQLDLVLFAGSLAILSHGPEAWAIDSMGEKKTEMKEEK